jgi:hypothetical protein
MRKELSYQAKIHAISDIPRKEKNKIPVTSPPIFYFYFYFMKNNKTCYKGKQP